MSLIGKLTEMEGANKGLLASIEALKSEHASAIAKLNEEHAAKVADLEGRCAGLKTERDELTSKLGTATAEIEAAKKNIEAMTADLSAKQVSLDAATEKLKNPAFVDASAKGQENAIADAGEAASASADPSPTWTAYNKITDAAARTKFWNENSEKLNEEMKRLNVR